MIQPTALTTVEMTIYSGSNRQNWTAFVGGDGIVPIGAPYKLPAENSAIINLRST